MMKRECKLGNCLMLMQHIKGLLQECQTPGSMNPLPQILKTHSDAA